MCFSIYIWRNIYHTNIYIYIYTYIYIYIYLYPYAAITYNVRDISFFCGIQFTHYLFHSSESKPNKLSMPIIYQLFWILLAI